MKKYLDYAIEQMKALLAIDSPTGYTSEVSTYLTEQLTGLGVAVKTTVKGGVLAEIGGDADKDAILLTSHVDTLGGMVAQIKENGRIRMTPLGGLNANNVEAENCRIYTKMNQIYEGTCQLIDASLHVNKEYGDKKRDFNKVEIVLDEVVADKKAVQDLGIMTGDIICFEPRTRVTKSGYIKSRFLDDKLSAAILLAYAKMVKEEKLRDIPKVYLYFTMFEEVGHGASAVIPEDVREILAVDMGCIGEGLSCTEREVSICAKDSGGPYHYDVVKGLIAAAQANNIGFAVDVYPFYGSDTGAALKAGNDIRYGLIGAGVYASHGYERGHIEGVENTLKLIAAYIGGTTFQ